MQDRRITATAPIRVCDIGGWTDTWFAGHGAVFSIAVAPRVEARLVSTPRAGAAGLVTVVARNYGDRYAFVAGRRPWGRHPIIEAAVESVGVPEGMDLEVTVASGVPPGASTGTSAAVAVAVLGALHRLHGHAPAAMDLASGAHRIETDWLGRQSGVQDQIASALGGVNFITIDPYPRAAAAPLRVPDAAWHELDRRLLLVYLGRGHDSSRAHEAVIRRLAAGGGEAGPLVLLRRAAASARDAVEAGDLGRLGEAMCISTDAQRALHEGLVGEGAERVVAAAREGGAPGWKVNGAGGDGGSVTVLCGESPGAPEAMARAIEAAVPVSRILPIRLSRAGLLVHQD